MPRVDPSTVALPRRLLNFGGFFFVVCFFSSSSVNASVHSYIGKKFAPKGNAFVLHGGSEGLFASLPDPNATAGLGDAFIRFEKITFTRMEQSVENSKSTDPIVVQAIIFEVEDRETIGGSAYGGQRAVCCTPDLAKLGACTQGKVIYRPSSRNPNWPQVLAATFNGKDLVATLPSQSIPITRTGMYNLYFIYCDPALNGLVIDGNTVWKNPTGYLPGRMAPLMNFYGFMSLAFVILGIFWFSQYVRFWREVLPLQNCITFVIALGMFEMTLWYFEYAKFNETGFRPMDSSIPHSLLQLIPPQNVILALPILPKAEAISHHFTELTPSLLPVSEKGAFLPSWFGTSHSLILYHFFDASFLIAVQWLFSAWMPL